MTKYTEAMRRKAKSEQAVLPPIWRGIGCLMMVFIPVFSYALAAWVVSIAIDQNWPVPYQLLGLPILPPWLERSGLAPIVFFIEAQRNLYGILLLTLIFVVALGALVSYAYAVIYKYVGPARYGPLDAPPPKVAVRRYKR